ncbi:tetratricopeptide repeat protein [Spongiactinospora sp. 9N601]|uniref:tetratricopeptide repeat protein n=1 Tax=Spongiactinospora sp. 9N601 TaxID=3375149 RepID=UPI0037A90C8B
MWRDRLSGQRLLLVLDNAASESQVEPLLPGAAGCLVLITSRTKLMIPGAVPLTAPVLPAEDGAELFARRATPRTIGDQDAGAGAELVRLCGGLPLAIGITAARYAVRPARSLTDLIEQMTTHDLLAELREGDHNVATAFELSYRDLPPARRRLMRMLGLYPGTDFDAYAIAALVGLPLAQTRAHLDALYRASLLIETSRGRYRLHDLLAAYTRTIAATSPDTTGSGAHVALERLLNYYTHTAGTAHAVTHPAGGELPYFPHLDVPSHIPRVADHEQALNWLETERGNLHAAVQAAIYTHPVQAIALPTALFKLLIVASHWEQAQVLHHLALAAACRADDKPGQASAHTHIGVMYRLKGGYAQAIDHLTQALALHAEPGNSPGQALAHTNLGFVFCYRGEYDLATDHHTQAIPLSAEAGDRNGQAAAIDNLGRVYTYRGDYDLAAESHVRALHLSIETGDRYGEACALTHLGLVHQYRGEHDTAVDHHTRALHLFTELGNAGAQGMALSHLGRAHRKRGDYVQAEACLTRALHLYTEIRNSSGLAEVHNDLGELLALSATTLQAYSHFRQALDIARSIGLPLEEARALEGIGRCHLQEAPPGDGVALLRQALSIYCRLGSPYARRVQDTLIALDMTMIDGGAGSSQSPSPAPGSAAGT